MTHYEAGDLTDWDWFHGDGEKAVKAFKLLANPPAVEVGTTPSDVVYKDGKMKLLRYRPVVSEPLSPPILIVYALVNKPYILDLQPDKSVVRTLLKGGFDVYLIDWGTPTEGDKFLTLDDYVNGYIRDCVDFIRTEHEIDDVSILGYCMGGTLSVMFSCLHPDMVRNLVLMASPLDSEADTGVLRLWGRKQYFDVDKLVNTVGNVSGDFMNFAYLVMNPVDNLYSKYLKFIERVDDDDFVNMFFRMEKWVNDGIPVAGETFREFIKKCYQDNQLVKGELEINGQKVDLGNIKMPLLSIIAEHDHLVPPGSSMSFNDLVPSEDKERIVFPTGHIGLSVSSKTHSKLWPRVVEWLGERSGAKFPGSDLIEEEAEAPEEEVPEKVERQPERVEEVVIDEAARGEFVDSQESTDSPPFSKILTNFLDKAKEIGIAKNHAEYLFKAGYQSIDKIKDASVDDLTQVKAIGKKTAKNILEAITAVEAALPEEVAEETAEEVPEEVPAEENKDVEKEKKGVKEIPLNSVNGIGPRTLEKLEGMGITSIDGLMNAKPNVIAKKTKMPLSKVKSWIEEARKLRKSK